LSLAGKEPGSASSEAADSTRILRFTDQSANRRQEKWQDEWQDEWQEDFLSTRNLLATFLVAGRLGNT
jgi:hypothetical protein